jgi:DnaJ-class molecular chaperone
MSNYYDLLGIPKDVSEKDIRRAYRKLARQYHPDVNQGDQASEKKFKEINEAYSVLSDADKRSKYDRYGDNWANWEQMEQAPGRNGSSFRWTTFGGDSSGFDFGGGAAHPFEDLFANLGRSQRQPPPAEMPVEITLEEAFNGATRRLELPNGRRLEVKIPPGVDNGSRVRVAAGEGHEGTIYLQVSVRPHRAFERKGKDLYTEVEIPLLDAVLGGETTVPTLFGQVALTIPQETQNGQRFRLSGQGMPGLDRSGNSGGPRGNLYATAKVKLPTGLTPEERDLFRQLKECRVGTGD